MATRTSKDKVVALLGRSYDSGVDLARPIASATAVLARIITCATAKSFTHTAAELELIECYLACYFYTKIDPLYTSKSTGGASGSFQRNPINDYLQGAIELDGSGCVNALMKQQRVDLVWLGKPESTQIAYEDRD